MSELIEAYRFGCRKGTIILSRLLQVIVVTVETGYCLIGILDRCELEVGRGIWPARHGFRLYIWTSYIVYAIF